jgi:hypothetical protein
MKNEQMKTYSVGITIYNTFCVEAETPDDAMEKVWGMDTPDLMDDADFNTTYAEELNS